MMTEMVHGQMYRLMVTGFSKDNAEVTKTEYLMVGASIEDIKSKFSYVVDVSDFSRYRFDYVVKEPGRVLVLSTKIERQNNISEDATIRRDSGTAGVWQEVSQDIGRKYSVRATTVCFAKDEKHAKKKLSARLLGGSELVTVVTEEVFAGDGYAKPKDVSMFQKASFVRG